MMSIPKAHSANIARTKPTLEIIPDQRFVVFHGGEYEASPVKLTGRVRLHAPEAMSILKPKVRLEGKRKISWHLGTTISSTELAEKRIFWNQEHKLGGIESTHKVKAGTIEWPFEFELSPSMPESVEGLRETYIVYHLHASVSRPGWNAKDVMASEHIRLVRTLGPDSLEMTRSRVNADIWANKVSYSISIPTDAIVFGTSITADVEISPLRKGIKLGTVETRLVETVVKRIQVGEMPDIRGDRTKSEEVEVAHAEMDFPEDSCLTVEDASPDSPTMADEMYRFKATLPLPKSLNGCRQDVDSHQINITHRFKLMVNIHNPEGHISQLVCRLPVKLFISPSLPVDEANEVHPGETGVSEEELNSTETTAVAPPQYGHHQLDQIYSGIDPSGFMSRAGSGPGTPAGLMALSRRGSQDNVLSLNGLADADTTSLHHGSAAPHLLRLRLADLQVSNAGYMMQNPAAALTHHSASGGTSPGHTDGHSGPHSPDRNGHHYLITPPTGGRNAAPSYFASLSRRTSDDANGHHSDYNLDSMSRVPSYGAALRTPTGAVSPFNEGPPSYFEATSRPPSPNGRHPPPHRTPTNPPGAPTAVDIPPVLGPGGAATPPGMTPSPASLHPGVSSSTLHPADTASRLRMLHART